MTGPSRKWIYVLEREPEFRTMLETLLTPAEVSISSFSLLQESLEKLTAKPCDLLIVDLEGCEGDGLCLLEQTRRIAPWVATLAIVGPADVPLAVRAVKAGAGDCLDKPVRQEQLRLAVEAQLAQVVQPARQRLRALTGIEIQILEMILAGKTSYGIAEELGRSKRTVDVHRKNIMRKLRACSLVDLIKRALEMGLAKESDSNETADSDQS